MNPDTKFKGSTINLIKEFKELQEDRRYSTMELSRKELRENKHLKDVTRLMETARMIQGLKMEFFKEIETLKRTQVEMKIELKIPYPN